ncbi:MAG: pyruvate kinase [Thermodesulfobacteriota bacterium]|nr:pyruvate kinase [Thermodesulfobacteriota bacterium]
MGILIDLLFPLEIMTYNKRGPAIRRTKIVCTIGPATSSPDQIKRLIISGMDIARLNFSHGEHDFHRKIIRILRRLSRDLGKEIGILQDLGGPKIRIGKLPFQELELKTNEKVVLAPVSIKDSSVIPVNYPYIVEDLDIGNRILMADGLAELEVTKKEADRIICRVVIGGVIHSHKGINLPASDLRISAFTKKDEEDLKIGLDEGVDFIALSFVRHEQDFEPILKILDQCGNASPLLIGKIEKPQAIQRLDNILDRVDGVMVARGDLGVEMPLEEVPIIQKKIIKRARQSSKPVITATQMLKSMINSPRPSRAEATDVANAILDGTDALMLSDETAIGTYPVEAVRILDRIARATEPNMDQYSFLNEPISERLPLTESAVSRSACWLARDLNTAAIVCCTDSGSTARLVARFRPSSFIIGLTPHLYTQRQLTLSWGVIPILVPSFSDTDEMFDIARLWTKEQGFARQGDRLIVTAGVPLKTPGISNLLRVIEV